MIPLKLSLQGFYSYQSTVQTIDFTRLTEAQLFGIFGATGSGKSSILEAISFVLYGESERLNKSGDNRSYNMMNLKSSKLYIDFEFAAGGGEVDHYKFVANGKRNSKRFEDVGAIKREAFKREHNEWVPIPVQDVKEIVGLNYDHFKRTIIIPQGNFQEFLKLTSTDRTRMLKDIFKLEKYELEPRVKSLMHKNTLKITEQETLLQQLSLATPEALEAVEQQLKELHAQHETKQTTLKEKEQELIRYEELKKIFGERDQQLIKLEALQAQGPAIEARKKRLLDYERCLILFQPLIERQQEYHTETQKLQRVLENKKLDEKALQEDLQKSETLLPKLKEQYLNRNQLLEKAEEWEKLVEIKRWMGKLNETEAALEKGKLYIKNSQREAKDFQARIEKLNREIKEIQREFPDVKSLMDAQAWQGKWEHIELEEKRLSKVREELNEQEAALEKQKRNILQPTSIEIAQYRLPDSKLFELLQQLIDRNQKKLKEQEADHHRYAVEAALSAHATALNEGEPCPLCGSVHHPAPATAQGKQQLEASQEALAQTQEKHKQLEKALHALDLQIQNSKNLQAKIEKWEAEKLQLEDRKQALEHTFVWQELGDKAQIKERLAKIQAQQQTLTEKQDQREFNNESLAKINRQLERAQSRLDELNGQFTQYNIEIQSAKKSLKQVQFDAYSHFHDESLALEAEKARKQFDELGDLYEQAEQQYKKTQSQLDINRGELDSIEQQMRSLTQKLSKTILELDSTLEASKFEAIEDVKTLLQTALDTSAERDEINRFEQDLEVAKANMVALEARISGKEFDTQTFQQLQQESEALREALADLNRQKGGLEREQSQLQTQLEQQAQLRKELKQLQLRHSNLNTLRKLFSRSGFVSYVSGIFLRNLCLAANTRFRKLTQGALSLEVSGDNSFVVRDFLNDGQLRSIKTLSGGQTFQAALSLALALAEQVQQQVQAKQNFFFIDEGFGSQDKNALGIIFETLKSLRKENRIVGVISHVEELQQEIDTFLKIENQEETGSKVVGSWEL